MGYRHYLAAFRSAKILIEPQSKKERVKKTNTYAIFFRFWHWPMPWIVYLIPHKAAPQACPPSCHADLSCLPDQKLVLSLFLLCARIIPKVLSMLGKYSTIDYIPKPKAVVFLLFMSWPHCTEYKSSDALGFISQTIQVKNEVGCLPVFLIRRCDPVGVIPTVPYIPNEFPLPCACGSGVRVKLLLQCHAYLCHALCHGSYRLILKLSPH